MSRIVRPSTVASRIGLESIFPRVAPPPAAGERDRSDEDRSADERHLREKALRQRGRGMLVDKIV